MKVTREHHHKVTPYQIEARRPLHQQTNGANIEADLAEFAAYKVRNARQASCNQPLVAEQPCCTDGKKAFDISWGPENENPYSQQGYKTCERVACEQQVSMWSLERSDTFRFDGATSDLRGFYVRECVTPEYGASLNKTVDTIKSACCVHEKPADGSEPYTALPGQRGTAFPTVPTYLSPYPGTFQYVSPNYFERPLCSPTGCFTENVPAEKCIDGQTNTTVAQQVARTYPCVLPTLASTATGALSTVAAYLTPTPTATIAATVPSIAVSTLAVAAGAVVSGAVVGVAVWGGYKFCQHLKREPFKNDDHSLEEAQQFVNKAFDDTEPRYTEAPESEEHIYEELPQLPLKDDQNA